MKLLLIQPPNCLPLMDRFFMFEPLALEYLGAGAKLDGHEVRIVDARIEPAVEDAAREFAPDVIGLTAVTSQVRWPGRAMAPNPSSAPSGAATTRTQSSPSRWQKVSTSSSAGASPRAATTACQSW